jgi:hypothetical protein
VAVTLGVAALGVAALGVAVAGTDRDAGAEVGAPASGPEHAPAVATIAASVTAVSTVAIRRPRVILPFSAVSADVVAPATGSALMAGQARVTRSR